MSITRTITLSKTIDPIKLDHELRSALNTYETFSFTAPSTLTLRFSTSGQEAAATDTVIAAHDPTNFDALNLADVQARWIASNLHGRTPAQIYTLIQGQVDGWSTLAAAKADLRVILPLLCAGLAWTMFSDQQ